MPDVKKGLPPARSSPFCFAVSYFFFSTNLYTQKQTPARATTAAQMQAIFLMVSFMLIPPDIFTSDRMTSFP